jgi:hypothetical protein
MASGSPQRPRRITRLEGIFCNNCGAKLDEAPTLLPDQRPPCPTCGSVARRFEKRVSISQAVETDSARPITPLKSRTIGSAIIAPAQSATVTVTAHDATVNVEADAEAAEAVGQALPPTVETHSGAAVAQARTEGRSSGVRGPRRIIDHLVVQGRSLWWTQLTEDGGWLLQVVDEAGEEIATAANYDPVEALAAVAEFILPGHPG